MRRLTRDERHAHAHAWIAAWNRRDLDAVLAAFAQDAIFVSPVATEFVGRQVYGEALYGVEAEHVAGSGEVRGRRTLIP